MYFLMTNDVEHQSLSLNREDSSIPEQILKVGLPRLLPLLSKYDVKSTFYFTGMFAEESPESIDLVKEYGHEIGCHGYDHSPSKSFDLLELNQQIIELQKAKKVIESISGNIYSFRAPALRINEKTVAALEQTGFKSDSSIASQRFDGPLTFGSKKKLKWLVAPRRPYYLASDSPFKKGNSNIFEIPISAAFIPYIGTTMRISPTILKVIQKYLFYEAYRTEKPVVFLFHPNECLDPLENAVMTRRSASNLEYLFADKLRHKLKLNNLGLNSLHLLDRLLSDAKQYGFEFVSANEYRKLNSHDR